MFGFNVLFFLIGVTLLLIGVWAQIEKNSLYRYVSCGFSPFPSRKLLNMFQSVEPSIEAVLGPDVVADRCRLPHLHHRIQRLRRVVARKHHLPHFLFHFARFYENWNPSSGLLLIAELAGAVFAYACKDQLDQFIRQLLKDVVRRRTTFTVADRWLSR